MTLKVGVFPRVILTKDMLGFKSSLKSPDINGSNKIGVFFPSTIILVLHFIWHAVCSKIQFNLSIQCSMSNIQYSMYNIQHSTNVIQYSTNVIQYSANVIQYSTNLFNIQPIHSTFN